MPRFFFERPAAGAAKEKMEKRIASGRGFELNSREGAISLGFSAILPRVRLAPRQFRTLL